MRRPHPSRTDRRSDFESLVEEVYEPLQRYLGRRAGTGEVDEVLNDVLLQLWRRIDDLPADGRTAWSFGVARRCLANHRRGGLRRLRLVERVGAAHTPSTGPDWTSAADVALHLALDRLDELDREVVRLWAWERLEPREIAVVLGTTPNAVSIRLHRVQRRLADQIERKDPPVAGQERDERHEEVER